MASPRLLFLASSFPYGLNDRFFAPEVRELVRQGVDVLAIPVRPTGPLTTSDAESLAIRRPLLDLTIAHGAIAETIRAPLAVARSFAVLFRSPSPNVLLRNIVAFPKALWIAQLARSWKADHIHAHWAGPPSTVAYIASRLSGVPFSFTAHFADIVANNLLREKSASAAYVRFIAVAMMKLAREAVPGIDDSRWVLVRFGVEMPERRAPRQTLGDPPVLLMGARFDQEKRHDLLIQATRRLLDHGLEVEVWLAGAGPTEDAMKQLVHRFAVDQKVRFRGSVPRAVLLEWLASGQVDVAVLPSDGEGLPVFLIEALAHYVPAIATDVGGVAELVGDGCGEVVPPDDADALADAIARVLRTPELREHMARAGRARVEREFAIESVVRHLRQLLGFAEDAEDPMIAGRFSGDSSPN